MKKIILLLLPFVLLGGAIDNDGVQNAAAWHLSTNVIAPGEIVMLMGSGFVPFGVEAQFKTVPVPTTLADVQVRFDGIAGALYYVSPTQINVQVPLTVVGGNTTITVFYKGAVVATTTVRTSAQSPGIFTYKGVPIITDPDGAFVSMTSIETAPPIKVGSTGAYIVLYGSGFGPTNPAFFPGEPAPLTPLKLYRLISTNVSATLDDGDPINITYIGLTPGSVGLYQINLHIPSSTKPGNHTLNLKIGGVNLPGIPIVVSTVVATKQ